ncbi:MAG: hypothetical protein HYS18_08940 [Burkholderiales bacterium]|nr:hypothetical protein [Burkholderiales bacterium]
MKTLFAALLIAFSSSAALAQDPASQAAPSQSATARSQQPGPGPGMMGQNGRRGSGQGMMRFGKSNTPGWSMMTSEERRSHQEKMMGFKTVDECRAYHEEHRKLMQDRAKERNKTLPQFRGDPCAQMQKRGLLK